MEDTNLEMKVQNLGAINSFLQFDLGSESYAVRLLNVKEVIPVPEVTTLPNTPAYYNGIMNLRGQIISIVDLRKRLKINPKTDNHEEAVIIVEVQGVAIGLLVDSINRVLNITNEEVVEVPEISSQVNAKYIQGVYRRDDSLTIFLDLENILSIDDFKKYSKTAGE